MAVAEEDIDEFDVFELQQFLLGKVPSSSSQSTAEAGTKKDIPLPPGLQDEESTKGHYGWEGGKTAKAVVEHKDADSTQEKNGLKGEQTARAVVELEDPKAPYLAATSWEELKLPQPILDGIYAMGFKKPSKIQEWTLPITLKRKNIIGQAQNGSGKTAAFAISMLLAADSELRQPQSMCVCPTRELAIQNYDVIAKLGKYTKLELFLGVPQAERAPRKVNAQLVVGTPGKLWDLLKKSVIDRKNFTIFVVDEADFMIDEKQQMGPQVLQIKQLMPDDVQVLLFSATWPERVADFAHTIVPQASHIRILKEELTLSTIMQTFIDVGDDDWKKLTQLSELYAAMNIGQSIVFVNTRIRAFDLAKAMKDQGHSVSLICGTQKGNGPEQVDHAYRDKVMHEFRTGVTKVLIATDVLSRGIDVPAVTLVINYQLPVAQNRSEANLETYMHRIGRTGRFGLKGIAVNLVNSSELPLLEQIKSQYKCSIDKLSGDLEEMEKLVKTVR